MLTFKRAPCTCLQTPKKDPGLPYKEYYADVSINSNHFGVQSITNLLNKKLVSIDFTDVSAWGLAPADLAS